ncbi:MAG: glycosyl hydrolase [Cytophagales bacterium]|nr:glycosyl hydrolase [Cytophagales bacterium]
MRRSLLLLMILSFFCFDADAQRRKRKSATPSAPNFQAEQFHGLQWRNIGPYRGGRANAIAGVIGSDEIYYAGYTGGGVWKTFDGGANWENLSDGQFTVGSIGDIAVSESDPNVVVVGSGEHAVRGVMTSYGDGVYKSLDAGKTWSKIGLEKTRHISDVIIHPTDFNTLYVGAQGAVHGPSSDRGVYKSTDGGQTWKKTLYIDENTGISSLQMDMTNPRVMYAATWQHRRYPWKVESGGPGSGVYKSTDGGETWTKIVKGLPEMMGKIGLSVSRANPSRVFALVEAEKSESGMYRSDDGGMTWQLMSNNQIITARSWYYMEVFADPNNENVVYALNAPLMKSIDGGKTFESMRVVHGDCHDFWINPSNSSNFAMAEDGGATISYSAGRTWSTLNNQPTAQFYRITADKRVPFWVYSGQQDNLSVAMPSRSKNYGILSTDWYNGPGCESAMVTFDNLENPRILYGGCFNGRISLLDVVTKEAKDIMPYPETTLGYEAKDMKYRFNWNAPLINSPHDVKTMYYGGNVLFRTTNGGLKWEVISGDLTKNDQDKQGQGGGPFTNEGAGGENYNTIYYIAESPHDKGVIYTGTDGGMIQLTKDGGKTWNDVTPAGLPETMIHAIEVSPHDPGTVYFASTRYKFNDYKNYSYKSTDFGTTWTKIGDEIRADDFFKVIREDPKVPGLLYAGAERGFYISLNGGQNFHLFQQNLPAVPITDMTIRDNDIAISTAGRGFWILDDISALQQSKGEFAGTSRLFEPKTHYRLFGNAPFYLVTEYAYGKNPAEGVTLDYYLPEIDDRTLTLEIFDADGEAVRKIEGTKEEIPVVMAGGRGNVPLPNTAKLPMKMGQNRFTWDFRTNGLTKVPDAFIFGADYRGHRVAPGEYSAKLTYGDETSEVSITILNPPELDITTAQWKSQQQLMSEIEGRINEIHDRINNSMDMSERLESISEQLEDLQGMDDLKEAGENLSEKIEEWRSKVIELRQKGFQDALNWPSGMNSEFFLIRNNLDTYEPSIPEGYKTRFNDLDEQWQSHKALYQQIMDGDVESFNELFKSKELPPLQKEKKEELNN